MPWGRLSPKLFFLPLILLLCCLQVQAQGPGTILGRVFQQGGEHPSSRVLVNLQFRGSPVQSTYADAEGRFAFYQLINNPYRVVIQEEGYQPVSELVVVRSDIAPTSHVTIILRPLEQTVESPPPDSVKGGNPHLVSAESYRKDFPDRAVKEFEAGRREAAKGKTDKAIKRYLEALKLAPDFYPAHNNLGTIYLSRQEFEKAEKAFSECLRLKDTDANAYFNLGNVYLLTGRYPQAEDVLRRGLAREPLSALGHHLLGAVQLRQRQFVPAEHSLLKARELDPGMPAVRLELVSFYLGQQRREDLIREIREFIAHFPDDPVTPKLAAFLAELESSASR